jgi:ribose transport system substrate-binding protein
MRRFVVAAALAVLVLVGCGKKDDEGRTSVDGRKVIGVALRTRSRDFDKELEAGLVGAADARGYRLVLQSAELDPKAQARQIDDFVAQKVDAIVLVPCDETTAAASLRGAATAKIPVFTADVAVKGADVVSHVASDDYVGGRLAGQAMAKLVGGRGNVIVVDHEGVPSAAERLRGFEDALKQHAGIAIVDRTSSDGDRAKAETVVDDALRRRAEIAGVFGVDDECALGAVVAIESAKREGIVVVGYDGTQEAQDEIRRGGPLKADVVRYPKRIGEKTIDAVTTWFAGEKLDKLTPVNVGIVDAASLGKPTK